MSIAIYADALYELAEIMKQYLDLCRHVMTSGTSKMDRTKTGN